MNCRSMFTLNIIVVAVFGTLLFGSPEFLLNWFGFVDFGLRSTVLMAHFFGGTMLVSAVFLWFLKDFKDLQKKVTVVLVIASGLGFLFTILGMLKDKVILANGWVLLVIFILFTLGYAYLLVSGKSVSAKEINP